MGRTRLPRTSLRTSLDHIILFGIKQSSTHPICRLLGVLRPAALEGLPEAPDGQAPGQAAEAGGGGQERAQLGL